MQMIQIWPWIKGLVAHQSFCHKMKTKQHFSLKPDFYFLLSHLWQTKRELCSLFLTPINVTKKSTWANKIMAIRSLLMSRIPRMAKSPRCSMDYTISAQHPVSYPKVSWRKNKKWQRMWFSKIKVARNKLRVTPNLLPKCHQHLRT
jgi:hypothetical protein